jgi:hypothetical protein
LVLLAGSGVAAVQSPAAQAAAAGAVPVTGVVTGYHLGGTPTAAGAFAWVTPARILDTRLGIGVPAAAIQPHQTVTVQVAGRGGVPASGAAAVAMTVTVANPNAI